MTTLRSTTVRVGAALALGLGLLAAIAGPTAHLHATHARAHTPLATTAIEYGLFQPFPTAVEYAVITPAGG